MNSAALGFRNAFRNVIRSGSIMVILGLSIGLALTMLVARQAVEQKITSVKASVGNTITISPAGFRGFSGTGNPLTQSDMDKVSKLAHITNISETLTDRLSSDDTNLQPSQTLGALGQRFSVNNDNGDTGGTFTAPDGSSGRTGNFTPPVQVVGTDNPTTLDQSVGGGTVKLTSGSAFTSDGSDDVAIVGTALASKNSLKVGNTFTAYGKTVKVVGIYDAGNTLANGLLIMPLKTVQTLSGQSGDLTAAVVTVDSVSNVSSVTSSIKTALGSSADVQSQQDQADQAVSSLENIKSISTVSLIGAIIAGAIIILLTMVMIVRERKREIGVLKAIGASNLRVMFQFMTEAVTLTLAGAVIGIIIGAAGSSPVTNMLVSSNMGSSNTTQMAQNGPVTIGRNFERNTGGSSTSGPSGSGSRGGFFGRNASTFRGSLTNIHASVGWSVLGYGLAAAIAIAVVGSSLAGWMIARVRPSEVMRTE